MSLNCWWCGLIEDEVQYKSLKMKGEVRRGTERARANHKQSEREKHHEEWETGERESGLKFRRTSRSCQNIQSFLAAEVQPCLQMICLSLAIFSHSSLLSLNPSKRKRTKKTQQVTVVDSSHDLIMRGLWVGFSRAELRWITTLLLQLPSEQS